MYTVKRRFNDRQTGKRYEVGERYPPPAGRDGHGRIDHLIAKGMIEEKVEYPDAKAEDECAPDS